MSRKIYCKKDKIKTKHIQGEINMKYTCSVCGYVYDEKEGCVEDNIAPNTLWADVPSDWVCPICGVDKTQFEIS